MLPHSQNSLGADLSGVPAASRLQTALWTARLPTRPLARWQPPPSSLQPWGPSHAGKGPSTFLHQGFFSTIEPAAWHTRNALRRLASGEATCSYGPAVWPSSRPAERGC